MPRPPMAQPKRRRRLDKGPGPTYRVLLCSCGEASKHETEEREPTCPACGRPLSP